MAVMARAHSSRRPSVFSRQTPTPTLLLPRLPDLLGNITPSGLHFERHHAGIPVIDPAKHSLVIHGLVGTPKRFTMADIRRMPSVTRKHFIECSGNTGSSWTGQTEKTVQASHGLLSTSEWTGVLFSEFAKQVGLKPEGTWVLAEGSDGAVMTRSIPMEKMLLQDAISPMAGRTSEAIRPEQGYPLRLVLPGYEGNTHIKWLQSLQVSDIPFMSREETSKYTDLMPDGVAWEFVFEMASAKSASSHFPPGRCGCPVQDFTRSRGSPGLDGAGFRVSRFQRTAAPPGRKLISKAFPNPSAQLTLQTTLADVGRQKPRVLLSRCADETGYVQPIRKQLVEQRGVNAFYHYNGIQAWGVGPDGSVSNTAA